MHDTNEEPEASAGKAQNGDPTVDLPGHAQELARLKEERDHLEVQLQRTLADTANMRRRQKQELDDGRRRVIEGLTQELLPVLDSFAMALQAHDSSSSNPASLVEGIRLVHTLLSGTLERHGLQEIAAAGLPFDPSRHEAVAVDPGTSTPEGHVIRVLQMGYLLGDRVVRHSRVVVAGPATRSPS